jgi:diacylglycerol kinase family enzyme
MKIGVLGNPQSRRNRKLLPAIEALLGRHEDVLYIRLQHFGELEAALRRFAAAGVGLLIISGGDGTISATLTQIFAHDVFAEPPRLAILPGGTSNTIAGDVGLRGSPLDALERCLRTVTQEPETCEQVERSAIRLDYDREKPAVCGMFFGTAAVCDAIVLRRRLFPQKWLPDPIAAAMTLAVVLGTAALGRPGVLSGQSIAVNLDGVAAGPRQYTIVIATTLERILLGGDPFWGTGPGVIKFTSIGSPPRGLVRHAYRLLYGRDRERLPPATYASAAADRVTLHMDCPFNLDGEFYEPGPGGEVILSRTPPARFIRC